MRTLDRPPTERAWDEVDEVPGVGIADLLDEALEFPAHLGCVGTESMVGRPQHEGHSSRVLPMEFDEVVGTEDEAHVLVDAIDVSCDFNRPDAIHLRPPFVVSHPRPASESRCGTRTLALA